MKVETLSWLCVWLFIAAGVAFAVVGIVTGIRGKRADDERPAKYRGVHRHGAVREPYQRPTWVTALAEPTDALTEDTQAIPALTEDTQAMPLVELRGEIGRHSSRQLAPVMAGPGWVEWTTDDWQIREVEVWEGVDAT